MESRLVLGYSGVGQTLVSALARRPGELLVAADQGYVETLRTDGIPATPVDELNASTISDLVDDLGHVSFVAVLGEDPAENLIAARAARQTLPDAYLFTYVGQGADPEARAALATVANRVYDPGQALLSHVRERLGSTGSRVQQLRRVLADVEGPLAIITHDNPDPDAIAGALALRRVARALGHEADVCYYGDISHEENRALINYFGYDLRHLNAGDDVADYGGVALVDHARPGVNDGLPPDTSVDIVIDHHPPRGPVDARFLDLRSDVGATSTLLVDYLRQLDLEPDSTVATGLLFGIRVDTRNFSRETSTRDFEAAAFLLQHADLDALGRIESSSIGTDTLQTLADAISNRHVDQGVLTSCVGSVSDRDVLAQAADRLLDMEGVQTALVYGIVEETLYVSGRSRGSDVDLGEALREAFAQVGSAGGHGDMAGAQIHVGMLVDDAERANEDFLSIVDEVVRERFREVLSALADRPPVLLPSESGDAFYTDRPD